MGWKPENHKPTKDQDGRDDRPVPAGTYLLGVVWMRVISENMTKLGVKVLQGPNEGRMAFVPLFTRMSSAHNANAIFYLSQAMGNGGLEWEFTEAWIKANLLGAAFKARLSVETNGEYKDHKIQEAVPRERLSSEEASLLLTWSDDFGSGSSSSSSDDDFGDGGDKDWADGRDDDPSSTPGDFDDDDIPF